MGYGFQVLNLKKFKTCFFRISVMRKILYFLCSLLLGMRLFFPVVEIQAQTKNPDEDNRLRVVIMSDFPPVDVIPGGMGFGPSEKRSDSDDVQSMIRFLLYSNEFDVEALIATSGTFANVADKQNILDILYLYDYVDENLRKHDIRYPDARYLRDVTWQGASGTWGCEAADITGEGHDSEASEKIIALLKQQDVRPVWFCVWGGSCDLAQALWKISEKEEEKEAKRLLDKVRIYLIGTPDGKTQDGTGLWMLEHFPDVFIIHSARNYMGMFYNCQGADTSLSDLHWVNRNIRKGHGLLGAVYPESGFYPEFPGVWEGDSPSFLYLVSDVLGISDSEKPWLPSWGGMFVRSDDSGKHWKDSPLGVETVYRWRKQVQEDFARRADWMCP